MFRIKKREFNYILYVKLKIPMPLSLSKICEFISTKRKAVYRLNENISIISKYCTYHMQHDLDAESNNDMKNDFDTQYITELEAENTSLHEQIKIVNNYVEELKNEIEMTYYQLDNNSCSKRGASAVILEGSEQNLYANEQTEIVIDILTEYLQKNTNGNSRRADIIRSLIKANPAEGLPTRYKRIIKDAFDGYAYFNCSKIRHALKETGITIVDHKGHYKLQYHNDSRYKFIAASTPSDHRAGENAACIINKLMF